MFFFGREIGVTRFFAGLSVFCYVLLSTGIPSWRIGFDGVTPKRAPSTGFNAAGPRRSGSFFQLNVAIEATHFPTLNGIFPFNVKP